MNARTVRRSIERKAKKQARKEAAKAMGIASGSFAGEEEIYAGELAAVAPATSELQLLANQRNAALSTGPTSPEGKARSSRNALKTGLTGKTVLLANEDAALYEHHVKSFFSELKPVGDRETELVQAIADSKWRLARIPSLEFGIYALGRIQFAEEFRHLPEAEAAILIEAKTFMAFLKQLNNLSIQECRLRRQCDKDTAELTRLQQLRAAAVRAANKAAANSSPAKSLFQKNGFEFEPADFGSPAPDNSCDPEPLRRPQAA